MQYGSPVTGKNQNFHSTNWLRQIEIYYLCYFNYLLRTHVINEMIPIFSYIQDYKLQRENMFRLHSFFFLQTICQLVNLFTLAIMAAQHRSNCQLELYHKHKPFFKLPQVTRWRHRLLCFVKCCLNSKMFEPCIFCYFLKDLLEVTRRTFVYLDIHDKGNSFFLRLCLYKHISTDKLRSEHLKFIKSIPCNLSFMPRFSFAVHYLRSFKSLKYYRR